jgi:hypothetical protein
VGALLHTGLLAAACLVAVATLNELSHSLKIGYEHTKEAIAILLERADPGAPVTKVFSM